MSIRPFRLAPLAVALAFAAGAPAHAQGTAEQQEACTPDAVRLCSATIPDIPKTTACMKAHVGQLSPRCRAAFNEVTGGASKPRVAAREERAHVATREERREERRMSRDEAPLGAPRPDVVAAPPVDMSPLAGYRAQIVQSCRAGLIDPFTCRNTLDALSLSD